MEGTVIPASEAKVISDGNVRVRRVLGMISQMIFEAAKSGQTHVFILDSMRNEHSILNDLSEEEKQIVHDILYDHGYMMVTIFEDSLMGSNTGDNKLKMKGKSYKKGFNIDWSGMYDE